MRSEQPLDAAASRPASEGAALLERIDAAVSEAAGAIEQQGGGDEIADAAAHRAEPRQAEIAAVAGHKRREDTGGRAHIGAGIRAGIVALVAAGEAGAWSPFRRRSRRNCRTGNYSQSDRRRRRRQCYCWSGRRLAGRKGSGWRRDTERCDTKGRVGVGQIAVVVAVGAPAATDIQTSVEAGPQRRGGRRRNINRRFLARRKIGGEGRPGGERQRNRADGE